ncbi:MAG: sugar phosphate isomerase/epimerase [Acidobacteriota bacterium]|nr:sugar phosphate isomerase/epimerase [Acidobacteriota bacterium]
MNRVLSTHLIVNHRLTIAWLEKALRAGIPAVEIFCARQHLDYRNKSQISELGYWFRDSALQLHSIHSPMYTDEIWGRSGPDAVIDITERNKSRHIFAVDEIKRAIEIAETVPFRYMVQHLGVSNQEFSEHAVEAAFTALEGLTLFAHQRGVEILLENIPNELSTAVRLQEFLKVTHLNMNFVFDLGHANIGNGVQNEFAIMKERIRSLHIHDNDGKEDKHLFPFLAEGGTVDWPETMELLRSRPDQYPMLLELKEVPEMEFPLDSVNQVYDRLERIGLEQA